MDSSPSKVYPDSSKKYQVEATHKIIGSETKISQSNIGQIEQRVMNLEGQCKIKCYQFLQKDNLKATLLMIIIVVTFFGLFALKYLPRFRKKVFYNTCEPTEATHLFIQGNQSGQDIVQLIQPGKFPMRFIYKKLRYVLISEQLVVPSGFTIQQHFKQYVNKQHITNGLSSAQIQLHREIYGNNEHQVQVPFYFTYLLDVMTAPYFLLQYFFCFAFFLQGYAPFSIALLAFTFITTTINYIMLYLSYKKIKEIAEQTFQVEVIRNGIIQKLKNIDLVPGDVYIPFNEIPADSLMLSGQVYVNQANLTGESFPIGKYPINIQKQIKNTQKWLYEGSKVLQFRQNSRALVINTNFATHRGRIIRRILIKTVKDPDIIRSLLVMTLQVIIVSMITFFATLFILLSIDIEPLFIFFKFIDFLASSAPPPLPIYFNIAYGLSLSRMRLRGISGTEPQKTVDGAQVKIFCFDKTGTLTIPDVKVSHILKTKPKDKFEDITQSIFSKQNQLIWKIFACCHTTKIISDEILGDQIDKQMFIFSEAEMSVPQDPEVKYEVTLHKNTMKESSSSLMKNEENSNNVPHLQVLRINQFQSKFQSMSVLVKDITAKKYYIFSKGAPQKINSRSTNKSDHLVEKVKELSHEGLRTIAIGYKQVKSQKDVDYYLKVDRDMFQQDLFCLGLIAFENQLKDDTFETMNKLISSNISPKMITGDNIYVAVETARRAGILPHDQKVIYLEGHRQDLSFFSDDNSFINADNIKKEERNFKGIVIKENFEQQTIILRQNTSYREQNQYAYAIDNKFLELEPKPYLTEHVKVFARITPENKAQIIKTYKEQDKVRRDLKQTWLDKLLKKDKRKVGMCGDGANDLLALRQADLSVGIQETDASYGSSFTINQISDVQYIIRESKGTQTNITQVFQFYISIAMTGLLISILMISDATYYSTAELMFYNFTSALLVPATLTMSFPSTQPTKKVPDPNSLNLFNHLIIWGHILIPFFGALAAYLFFYNHSGEFQPNPIPKVTIADGFNSKNHSATLLYVLVLLVPPFSSFLIYRSSPFKRRIWFNPLLSLLIVINFICGMVFPFFTDKLEVFQMIPISIKNMGICLGIMLGSLVLLVIYNTIVNCFHLNQKTLQSENFKIKNESNSQ